MCDTNKLSCEKEQRETKQLRSKSKKEIRKKNSLDLCSSFQ